MHQKAYKLVTLRKDGTIGPLFINRRQRLPLNEWLEAEEHPTKGFKVRPGWHCTCWPNAPHLSIRGRAWVRVLLKDYQEIRRPEHQGGLWFLAQRMHICSFME